MARIGLIVVACVATLAVFTVGLFALMAMSGAANAAAGSTQTSSAFHAWLQTVADDGSTSEFFIPSYDIHGAANGAANGCNDPTWGTLPCVLAKVGTSTRDGNAGWAIHLNANPPHAFDEWSQDGTGASYWSEWYFNSANHTIELWRYASRNGSDQAQGVPVAPSRVIPDIAWMVPEILLASQTPYASPSIDKALTDAGKTICPSDNAVHLFTALQQPATPSCYPYDALEHMVGSPREIVGGNYFLVVRVQGIPAHAPSTAIPAVGVASSTSPDLWDQEVVASAFVPFGRKVQLNYTPPPAGTGAAGFYVEPQYFHYARSGGGSGTWEDASGHALPGGPDVTIAQTWYTVPWTLSQTSCKDATTGRAINPSTVYGLSGYSEAPWSVPPSSTQTVPASAWTSGPFAGEDVGYGEAQPALALISGLDNADTVNCRLQVASQSGQTANVSIVVDPAATPGPLRTLSSVEFSLTAIAEEGAPVRTADIGRAINALAAGGTAAAGTSTCSYAQLYYYNAAGQSVLDTNDADGANQTDANGCVVNNQVRLWATESNYSGQFFQFNQACKNYATVSAPSWAQGSYVVVSPVAATTGCQFPVYSSVATIANGGAKNVTIIFDPNDPCKVSGNVCMALQQFWSSETVQGGGVGIPIDTCTCTDTQDYSLWSDIYVSSDGGSSWSFIGVDLYSTKRVTNYIAGRTQSTDNEAEQQDTGPSCTTSGTYQHWIGTNQVGNQAVTGTCQGQTELNEATYKYDVYANNPYLGTPNTGAHWQTAQPPGLSGATLPTSTQFYPPSSV